MDSILPERVESEESSGTTTMSSSDSDVECEPLLWAMPSTTQWSVEVAPSCLKRTCGVNRTVESITLDEQLDGLRALLPNSARRRERNGPSVVMDAYRYIVELQQEVEELTAEILDCEADSSNEKPPDSFKSRRSELASIHQPMVEVMRRDGLMEVRIVCANRPGLLVDVVEAVETRGLSITEARIACQIRDSNTFKYLSLENEQSATISLLTEGGSGKEELDNLKAILVSAICQGSLM